MATTTTPVPDSSSPTEITREVWRAKGRFEHSPCSGAAKATLTLSVTKSAQIITSGRWTVTLAYNYLGEREETLTTYREQFALHTFMDWCKGHRMYPVRVEETT